MRFPTCAALCALPLFGGCSTPESAKPELNTPVISVAPATATLVDGTNNLGFSLLKDLNADRKTGNVLVSPFSIATALAMAEGGAAGGTQSEMARLLGTDKTSDDARDQAHAALADSLRNATGVKISIANSLWLDQGFDLNPDFQARSQKAFGANLETLDFEAPDSATRINDWVKSQTGGKIDEIIEKLDPDDRAVLVNAVYFRGDWLDEFDKNQTTTETFSAPGGTTEVPLMRSARDFRYTDNEKFQMVALPYKGQELALYVILPRAKLGLNAFLKTFDAPALKANIAKMSAREGTVYLPRFEVKDDIELSSPLQSLGMKKAFSVTQADFSRMASKKVFISRVLHKTTLEVDEAGTVATATTAVVAAAAADAVEQEPFEFRADRPFLLALRDDKTGAILFLGVVNRPKN